MLDYETLDKTLYVVEADCGFADGHAEERYFGPFGSSSAAGFSEPKIKQAIGAISVIIRVQRFDELEARYAAALAQDGLDANQADIEAEAFVRRICMGIQDV